MLLKLKYVRPLSNLAFEFNLRCYNLDKQKNELVVKVAQGKRTIAELEDTILDLLSNATGQGLTLVHFSAQLEPCLTDKYTLHALKQPLDTGYTIPTGTPCPIKSAQVELRSQRV